MPSPEELAALLFSVDSIWSVVIKGGIWLVIAIILLVATDNPDPDKALRNLKSQLGFFVLFITLSGGLIYLLFGQTIV